MTTPQLVYLLKSQGLTNRDIIDLYKLDGYAGLVRLAG